MVKNIFGPKNEDKATSTRPIATASNSAVDLFFKDCTDPRLKNGTIVKAQFLNFMMQNLRNAVRGMGVPADEIDDDLLLKAFKIANSGKVDNQTLFLTPGVHNFTVPDDVDKVIVTVIGGGGAAGSTYNINPFNPGGGGGGGGYVHKLITGLTAGTVIPVIVGDGGKGVAGANGAAGETSSFGVYCSATGGLGGYYGQFVGLVAAGGNGVGGDLNIIGGSGGLSGKAQAAPVIDDIYRVYGLGGIAAGGLSLVHMGGTGSNGVGIGAGGTTATGAADFPGGNGSSGMVKVRW